MRFKKFIIENYRAIERVEVPLKDGLIPIIGINESGKTSILKAILAFDNLQDSHSQGEHLHCKNNYEIGEQPCSIKAEISISEDDLKVIAEEMKIDYANNLLVKELRRHCIEDGKNIIISRELINDKGGIYKVELPVIAEDTNEILANTVYSLLPYILYFDDFSDRVLEPIPFTEKQITEVFKPGKGERGDWQSLIEEIFYRSSEISIQDFFQIEHDGDREGVLNDVKDELNKEIIKEWNRLKNTGNSDFADDEGDLELKIKIENQDDGGVHFSFKVMDKSHQNKSREFSIAERSKGFQWFFNFMVKLKYNAKYKNDKTGAIYLLDEPGSYLHSTAQEELIKELKRISDTNTIIYCTHSQYLLDPDKITIRNIKIALREKEAHGSEQKQSGKVLLKNFGEYGLNNNLGYLTPLYDALRLKVNIPYINPKFIIITEGITDYYFFKMFAKYSGQINTVDFTIIPGAGASLLKDLISIAIAWSQKYLILMDSDKAGNEAYKDYTNKFGEDEAKNFYRYNYTSDDVTFVLENFLTEKDSKRLLEKTKATEIKQGFILLYNGEENSKKEFIEGLDVETIENLKEVTQKINQLIGSNNRVSIPVK